MPDNQKACSDSGCSEECCDGCEKNPESFLEKTHEFNSI